MFSSRNESHSIVGSVMRNKVVYLFLSILVLVGLVGCCPPFCIEVEPTISRPFMLAYVDTNWQLRIRLSYDGTDWYNARGVTYSIDRAPGIAANDTGSRYLAVFVDSSRTRSL